MPSERVQRRIDRLLDEAEAAADAQAWAAVRRLAREALGFDPEHADAAAFLGAADRVSPDAEPDVAAETAAVGGASTGEAHEDTVPDAFAGGRYVERRFLGEGGKKRVYLARLRMRAGQEEEARSHFNEMREALADVGGSLAARGEFITLIMLDDVLGGFADDEFLNHCLRAFRDVPDGMLIEPISAVPLDRFQGGLLLAVGDLDEAHRRFEAGLALCERERCPVEAGRCLQGLAEVAERRGEREKAMEYLDRAGELFSRHGAKLYLDQVLAKKEILRA